jgi:acyl-CoA dehydrogenase
MQCAAREEGDAYLLDGEKTWISNGGIADLYCVFARTGGQPGTGGTRGISAFVVHAAIARRALDEALVFASLRRVFGAHLSDLQLTQATLGDMAADIDAAALLTYRAAWMRDVQGARTTREAAMAKCWPPRTRSA